MSDEFFTNIRNYYPSFLIKNNLSYINNKENYHKKLNIISESIEKDIGLFIDLIDTIKKALTFLKKQKIS